MIWAQLKYHFRIEFTKGMQNWRVTLEKGITSIFIIFLLNSKFFSLNNTLQIHIVIINFFLNVGTSFSSLMILHEPEVSDEQLH